MLSSAVRVRARADSCCAIGLLSCILPLRSLTPERYQMSDNQKRAVCLEPTEFFYCAALAIVAFIVFSLAKMQAIPFLQDLVTFDGHFYLAIAQHGYAFDGNIVDKQNVAYLPLEAAFMFVVDKLLPGRNAALKIAILGVAILFGTLVGLFALLKDYVGKHAAHITTLLWAFGPLTFYYFVGYSEPLFALATAWCLVALHRGWLWTASLIVGVMLLGRPHTVILGILVGFELLRQSHWRPWRMLNTDAPFQIAVMVAPLMAFATWDALRFGDAAVYINSLEAWRVGSFVDGNLSFFPALGYYFAMLSTSAPQMTSWTAMLACMTLALLTLSLALSGVLPKRILALYLGLLFFVAVSTSFDAENVTRHVTFMVPWAITLGIVIAEAKVRWWNKYLAVTPLILFFLLINVTAVARYYHGEWVS